MKQRLGIATALVHDPDLIILDEPTNGLDPQGIADVRNLILQLSRELKKTLVISSHLLSEMELIADSMLIIDKGKKIVEGKVNELFDPAETIVELKTPDDELFFGQIKNSPLTEFVQSRRNDCIVFKLHREQVPAVLEQLVKMQVPVLSFYSRHSLEDYFLSLTGQPHVAAFKN
jgi:ABC-type multidrug transport system ATPase subunit